MRSAARSVEGSLPSTCAGIGSPFSPKRTVALLASPTTCAFVTTVPRRSTRKPVPEREPACTETTPDETVA